MDRIDIHIEVPSVPFDELSGSDAGATTSAQMREEVNRARQAQAARFNGGATRYNAQMSSREVRRYCVLGHACTQLLRHSVEELGLSARAHDKVLRVARTIADVDGSETIAEAHLNEAINYRSLDVDLWT